ncbi:MAG: hypothetical protein HZB65_01045 [Candidatus Aenigmarchaeota archaeon]|nr:hypothetical protein [Candidatus Aenigmarchaeota archaeon]
MCDVKKMIGAAICMTIAAVLIFGALATQVALGGAFPMNQTLAMVIVQYFVGFLFLGAAKMCIMHKEAAPAKKRR